MVQKSALTTGLAVLGTLLIGIPLLAPLMFAVLFALRAHRFQLDYLMPAELFPLALVGGLLLLWAALRARSRRRLIGWGLAAALGLLAGGLVLGEASGLASGQREPAGPWFIITLAAIIGYSLALAVAALGGVLLLGDLFRSRRTTREGAPTL